MSYLTIDLVILRKQCELKNILAFRYNRLTGVDISKEMINFAQLNNNGNPRLDFRLLNILDDAELDKMFPRTFDKIFSFYCIHWVRDQRYDSR